MRGGPALSRGPRGEPAIDRVDEAGIATLEVVVGHAQAPRQEAHRELERLETAVITLGLFEPFEAHLRRALQALDLGPALLLVGREGLGDLAVALERLRQRDRVLERQLRARADREMRGVRGVADQHDVLMAPAVVANGGKAAPERAVLQEAMALQLLGEELLAEGQGLILVRVVKAGTPPGLLRRLENEGRHRG